MKMAVRTASTNLQLSRKYPAAIKHVRRNYILNAWLDRRVVVWIIASRVRCNQAIMSKVYCRDCWAICCNERLIMSAMLCNIAVSNVGAPSSSKAPRGTDCHNGAGNPSFSAERRRPQGTGNPQLVQVLVQQRTACGAGMQMLIRPAKFKPPPYLARHCPMMSLTLRMASLCDASVSMTLAADVPVIL